MAEYEVCRIEVSGKARFVRINLPRLPEFIAEEVIQVLMI